MLKFMIKGKKHGVDMLGGRFSDIISLVSRLNQHSNLKDAIISLMDEKKYDVKKQGFPKDQSAWSHAHFWKAIQTLVTEKKKKQIVPIF